MPKQLLCRPIFLPSSHPVDLLVPLSELQALRLWSVHQRHSLERLAMRDRWCEHRRLLLSKYYVEDSFHRKVGDGETLSSDGEAKQDEEDEEDEDAEMEDGSCLK